MSNLRRIAVILAVLLFSQASPCSSLDESPDDFDEFSVDTMNQRFDWVITADTTGLKRFLDYPTSGLHPVSKVKVSYRLTPRLNRQRLSFDSVLYEELWYHECKPIGCRKFHTLGVDPGQQGVIHFRQAKDVAANHCAIANTTVRLLLDTGLQKSMLSCVIVPAEVFDAVVSDLGQFNFFPFEIRPDTGIQASMHIELQSEPKGRSKTVYYFQDY